MSSQQNPYAPPQSIVDGGGATSEYWREGDKALHIERGADLPPRCVKCNRPALTPIKSRKVYWHHPGIYFLILLSLLIYLIVALITRKTFEVSPGLCQEHTSKRNRNIAIAWSLFLGTFLMIYLAASNDSAVFGWLAFASFVGTIVMGIIASRIVYPTEITTGYAKLKGFGEPFLKSIPPRVRYSGFSPPPAAGGRVDPTFGSDR